MLVLSPHQDDETLGCGGVIATASGLGLRPRVAFLTDGAASHEGSAAWPPRRLAATRRSEAIAALAVLGVGPDDILFLDWADASPFAPDQLAYAQTVERLAAWAASFATASLWSTWPGEAHCDHVAAARLAESLATRLPSLRARMEFLVWGWKEKRLGEERRAAWALDCAHTIDQRRRALACHRTQTTDLIADAVQSFRIPPELAALTERPVEIYLEAR
jgi:LmbE family N-acetylglucosaminyl deacetylase